MNHRLQCKCGMLKGYVSRPEALINRGICYCKDCRDYAHVLGKAAVILDSDGGTEVVAVSPGNIVFTQGLEKLSCLSLSEKGLLRWYAACCNTLIGNTPRNFKLAFVGVVHNCLEQSEQTICTSVRTGDDVGQYTQRQRQDSPQSGKHVSGNHANHEGAACVAAERQLQEHPIFCC